jgi:hypothetical protein
MFSRFSLKLQLVAAGVALSEVESETALYESVTPWVPFIDFRIVPIVEIEKAVPLAVAAIAWRESIKGQ